MSKQPKLEASNCSDSSKLTPTAHRFYITKTRKYRGLIVVSFFLSALGYALIATLDESSNV